MRSQWLRSTGLPRFAVVLIVVVVVAELLALLYPPARQDVLGIALLVLDPIGAVYGWRASRRSPARSTWRLAAASRAYSFASTIAFTLSELSGGGNNLWWWLAVTCGLAMFLSASAAALTISSRRLTGSQRWAFFAEVGTVLSSGFMLTWYFSLDPALSKSVTVAAYYDIGYPLGNLLLLSAVAAVLIRGAVYRPLKSTSFLLAGMLLYALGDAAFSAARVQSEDYATSSLSSAVLVLGTLLMAVAAVRESAAPREIEPPRTEMPAWSAHLPYLAVALGNTLLVYFTVKEGQFLLWGGLIIGQTAMTAALAVRQIISVRDSRRLTVVDALTGLANITGLQHAQRRRRDDIALMLIDLDGFKLVNDGYGHAAGDRLLVEFARLLRDAVRRGDTPARVGGDEFVVLLNGVAGPDQVVAVAERLLAGLAANPVTIDGDDITIRCSIGFAVARPGETPQEVQRRADLAMYESKRSGAHGWRMFEESMTDRRSRDALITDKLLPALAAGQFTLVYQPIVDMAAGRVLAAEALLRWTHPTLGVVGPMEFVPIAERTGAINDIGRWALNAALEQARLWPDLRMNVNVSACQLRQPDFVADVLSALDRTGVEAGRLTLEITETSVIDEEVAIPALEALREHGVVVALDDFGTGYSSLHYLARLPIDILKIDRAFVGELDSTTKGAAVAEAIIRLGQVLGLTVVAEGVETAAQAAELQMLGCSTAQGYLFHPPKTVAEFGELVTPGVLKG